MATKTEVKPLSPGTFKPLPPEDTQGVLKLYAIASRAVWAEPHALSDIDTRLQDVMARLVPPESQAAEECARLWRIYLRTAIHAKPVLRRRVAEALYRDLEAIGQRMDLPPLESWEHIPNAIDQTEQEDTTSRLPVGVASLKTLRRKAKKLLEAHPKIRVLPGRTVLDLLYQLYEKERGELFNSFVATGFMSRSEIHLLERSLARKVAITDEDQTLVDVVARVGKWLVEG